MVVATCAESRPSVTFDVTAGASLYACSISHKFARLQDWMEWS